MRQAVSFVIPSLAYCCDSAASHRPVFVARTASPRWLGVMLELQSTHVCACFARPLSKGVGSYASCIRSLRMSTTSTPEYDVELDS